MGVERLVDFGVEAWDEVFDLVDQSEETASTDPLYGVDLDDWPLFDRLDVSVVLWVQGNAYCVVFADWAEKFSELDIAQFVSI